MRTLKDKVAIITGAGRGIGRALAEEFAANGIKVVCAARTKSQIDDTARNINSKGSSAIAIPCDVTNADQVENLLKQTVSHFGKIDILFNNAGSFSAIGPIWEIDPNTWFKDVTINLLGPMLTCQAALKYMIPQNSGIIINMNGGGSTSPLIAGSAYGSSKAALLRLTDTLAAELEKIKSDILVFAMGPGFVKTEMTMLQTSTQAQKWIPSSKEALDKNLDRPPQDCAKATIKLLQIADPRLNGRVFGVGTDFDHIAKNLDKIKQNDLYTMRFRK